MNFYQYLFLKISPTPTVSNRCLDGRPQAHHYHSYFVRARISPSSFVPVILLYSEVTYYHYQSKHSLSTGLNYMFT